MKQADAPEVRRQPLRRVSLCLALLLVVTAFAACNGDPVVTAPRLTETAAIDTPEATPYPSTATIAPSPFTPTPVSPTATVQPTSAPPTATAGPTSVPPATVPPTNRPPDTPTAPPATPVNPTATVQPTNVAAMATVLYTPTAPPSIPVIVEAPTEQPTPAIDGPVVIVEDKSFVVELAVTPAERNQGLSGHPPLADNEGMLFVFQNEAKWVFWMKDMLFPLDMIWIDARCMVVDITENAPMPEPGQALPDLPRFFPETLAQYVLEVNAGTAQRTGISIGDRVVFGGSLDGRFGC